MTSDGAVPSSPTRGQPGATLAAVAARVGVSRTTVSNAYNRPDQLSTALRSQILAAAAELGYSGPDPVARSLRTRQADAVGLIFAERLGYAFRDPGAVEFLHGLGEACTERGRSLLMIPAAPFAGRIDTVLRAAVDGFVVSSVSVADPLLAAVLSRSQPAVIVDSPRGIAGVDFVGIDDRAGFGLVAEHVFALGHRSVGVIAVRRGEDVEAEPSPMPLLERLNLGQSPHPVRQLRLTGLLDQLVAGASVAVTERTANSRDEGALGAAALLSTCAELTAIMCTSDILALGVLDELAARGIVAGRDLTVTGFDDVPAAAVAGLTTVHQPLEGKGRSAIESLLDDRPRTTASSVILPTSLVVRSSSGLVR
ncbi:MAG: LacI family DNA-binding transcriptional regulator [Actinomycetota bacterium]|nr:LacI family DNA-binding transcriptional regulator [Actinomycetota bacterium]MDQ2956365.1 LacI family DNA-binding transcriptional regulator [Actinomycetota bacterium]